MADENARQEGPEGPQEPREDNSGIEGPSDTSGPQNGSKSQSTFSQPEDLKDPEMFPRAYVESLRSENRSFRDRAQRADLFATEVRRLAVREAARLAGLNDPEVMGWDDAWQTEDGLPDHDQLLTTAQALARSKPWLARPRGPLAGQGEHSSADEGLSLSALLRA